MQEPRPTPLPIAPPPRAEALGRLAEGPHDVLVVGGGITGAGIAHDLALRGVRVALIEKGDWGSGTSSASSRLVHGGLRYLEQFEISLVRESCLERGLLLRNAAGLVWPERFLFPLHAGGPVGRLRLAAGLGLYTLVSIPRVLGLPRLHGRRTAQRLIPGLEPRGLTGAGAYLDGATDDARLTLAVVATARQAGAVAVSRCELTALEESPSGIAAGLLDRESGATLEVRAREVVLAGGPSTDELRGRVGLSGGWVDPTRGAHVLVPRERLPTDGGVIFPSAVDQRVLFMIPWPNHTVIGTTDLDHSHGTPIRATWQEVQYLLDSANGLVPDAQLGPADVVSSWAGLRPLLAATGQDPSIRSREERVERSGHITTIAGGKLTGYRSMAEKLGADLTREMGRGDSRSNSPTRHIRLVGALPRAVARPGWSSLDAGGRPCPARDTWQRRYGAFAGAIEAACGDGAEAQLLDANTRLGEVDWSVEYEDCRSAVDFLFRRTDLGFGSRREVEAMAPVVLERLAATLGWNPDRRAEEAQAVDRALDSAHAWRGESDPAS